jgi:hypothetical protein
MRVAIYYAPAADDPLHEAGSRWLGRDAGAGPRVQPALPDIAAVTVEARRYGFHATLKPPMRLVAGATLDDVLTEVTALARTLAPFALPPLAVANLHGFLALRETRPSTDLQALADACVAWPDTLRAPADAAETERRLAAHLSPARAANLRRWGYPDVFATWQFHMTLSRRLSDEERAFWQPAAAMHFAAALAAPREVRDLAVFVEDAPGAEFRLVQRSVFAVP